MKPPRLTIRSLMVAVAIVGLIVGTGLELRRRHRRFSQLAATHLLAAVADEGGPNSTWHLHMWVKYRRAARHPWLPVAPDPPVPE